MERAREGPRSGVPRRTRGELHRSLRAPRSTASTPGIDSAPGPRFRTRHAIFSGEIAPRALNELQIAGPTPRRSARRLAPALAERATSEGQAPTSAPRCMCEGHLDAMRAVGQQTWSRRETQP
ncbi:hypothetical protein BE20_17020 [Sorangium cellulosum]|uniref:Uncharacterized protein n=1 Tax=Sorangium cellulosum TaxID=56 RepID=A0A150T0Y2_SORCE|nr:hypothetical protein BE20_17020 [Sorangium cellulosum]KYF98361.1 hypothetical protein BE18_16320 [Sorangium cellulosum]